MKTTILINDKKIIEVDFHKSPLDFAGWHVANDYFFAFTTRKRNRWMVFRKRAKWNRAKVRRFFEITRDRHTQILFTRPSWYLVLHL